MSTVAKSDRITPITLASASAGPFDLSFRLFDNDGLDVFVNQVRNEDFTISSSFTDGYDDNATITFGSSLAIGDVIEVQGNLTPHRADDFLNGPNLTENLNIEQARILSKQQELARDGSRSIRAFEAIDPIELEADKLLIVGSDGASIEMGPTAVDIADAQENAEIATAAAEAAQAILDQFPLVDGARTVNVPTDFLTLQAALDAVAAYRHDGTGETRINIEAGHEVAAQTTTFGGEFSSARIVSVDALPAVSASFLDTDTLMSYENCVAPMWDTLVDLEGRGNNGIYIGQGASMVMAAGSGVVNAGANGDNPNGAALLILGGTVNVKYDASLASGFVADGAARRGVWATIGGSFAGKFGSYENVGTDPAISEGNASMFGSRNGFIYDDNCSFDGSVRGIRNGGATVQARDVPSSTIKGHVAWTFLGGTTLMEQGVTPDSGWNGDWSVYGSNYSDRVDISSAESAATDLDLNGDGSKMFVIGANGDDITEWSLVGAYDFDGKVLNGAFSVASEETAPTSLDFRSDGQRVAVIGTASDSIHRYNLSTGYDVTSTVTLIESVSLSAWTTSPQAIRVSEDRLKAFVLDISGTLHEFTLASEFTFTGMTLAASHDFTAYGSDFRAFDFADAGSKLILVGRADDRLLEFDLSTAYNPATAVYGRYDWLKSAGANNTYTTSTLTGFRFTNSTRFFFTGESSGVDHVWKYVTQNYPLFYVGGVASDRSQGGGTIIAESASVNGALWTIAEVDTPSGTINIDDIVSATGLLGPVATITGGLVSAQRSVFVSSANSVAPQMVLISDAGEFEGTGCTLDGGGVVPYLVAVTENGRAHLRGAKLLSPATKLFDFRDGSGEIFLHDNTINGVAGKFPNGVILGDGANFATRAEAVDAITYGFRLTDGKRFVAAGTSYVFLDGATGISDMLGVKVSQLGSLPEDFGAGGGGVSDDTAAIIAWAASGGSLACTAGATYLCSTLVSSGGRLSFAARSVVEGNGATIKFTETDASNSQRGTLNTGAILSNLKFYWSDNGGVGHYFERFLACKGDNLLDNATFEAETDQPDANDNSGYDTTVRVDGDNVSFRGVKFINIWDCARAWAGAAIDDGAGGTRGPINFMAFDTRISGYSTGFTVGDFYTDVLIDGLSVDRINAHSGPNPGENAISGGVTRTAIRNVVIRNSAEHAIYLAATAGSYGLTLENVRIFGSGQCAVKLRGWTDFVVRNVHAANAHNSSSAGTNEDGLRIEECTRGRVTDYHHGSETDPGNGGYVGLFIDSCSNIDFVDCSFRSVQGTSIVEITDGRVANSINELRFFGLQADNANRPLFNISVGDLPDKAIIARDVFMPNSVNNIVVINATGAVGETPVDIQGYIRTTGTRVVNTAGGEGVKIDAGVDHLDANGADDVAKISEFDAYRATQDRVIYASVSGSGSGATAGTPANIDNAVNYVRALMLVSENTEFTIQLAAGTYSPSVRNQLDDGTWSFGTNQLNILGVDTGGAEPTTIISGASLSSGWFTKYSEISRPVNLNVRDIKFTGFNSSKPFVLRYGGGRWASSNLWSTGTFGLLELRGFYCEVRGSDTATPTEITGHTTGAIVLMDCYYEVGDDSGLGGTGVIDFNGTGDNVLISRRSVGYVRSCVFTAGATHITIGRLARLRTQSNSFVGWTVAAIEREDASAIWNNDNSNLDTIDASSLTTSTPFLRTGAVGMTPWSKGSTWEPHAQLHGCAASIASNSSEADRDITEVANGGLEELGPRPPEFFLYSQSAAVRLAYDITLSDTNGATMKVFAGTALLGSITIPSAAGVRDFRVFFEINGGSSTVATGTFSAIAYGDGSVVASNAGSTVSLATGSARGASVAELDWKVTATQTNGTGTLLPKAFNCELTF